MNTRTAGRLTRNVVVVATLPAALVLMGGTAHAAGNSGDVNRPQPLSHADQNDTGANPGTTGGCGAYCSTRDGSASANGRGDSTTSNKPCAGCVGKADNKDPKGQAPSGPVDHNAGYECDRNQGIGQGNPAHTGCTTPTSTGSTPGGSTPGGSTPGGSTPGGSTPGGSTPGGSTPGSSTPGSTGSGNGGAASGPAAAPVIVPPVVPAVVPAVVPPVDTGCPSGSMPAGSGTSCTPPAIGTPTDSGSGGTTVDPPRRPATTPTTIHADAADAPTVLTFGSGSTTVTAAPAGGASQLPLTGDNTGALALAALVLIATGGGLSRAARKH